MIIYSIVEQIYCQDNNKLELMLVLLSS